MEAVSKGRALPPRPTLLVGEAGDVEACRSSWARLQPVAEELLRRAKAGCASAEELDSAVRRFRSLRESLVAAYVRDEFAIQVYECSVDVCLAARCWPEFLKSVAGLTGDLYPHLEQQQQQQQRRCAAVTARGLPSAAATATAIDAGATAGATGGINETVEERSCDGGTGTGGREQVGDGSSSSSSSSSSAGGASRAPQGGVGGDGVGGCNGSSDGCEAMEGGRSQNTGASTWNGGGGGGGGGGGDPDGGGFAGQGNRSSSNRRGEMVAAHVLFLACAPSGRLVDAAAQLRNPASLSYMTSATTDSGRDAANPLLLLQFTIKVLSSLAVGDWYGFLKLLNAAPRPSFRAILGLHAQQVRRAAVRSLAAAFRTLPIAAAMEALRIQGEEDNDNSPPTAATATAAAGQGGARVTRGSAAGLRTVLADAAAAGVRGAVVALEGLSAWSANDDGEGSSLAELTFRS